MKLYPGGNRDGDLNPRHLTGAIMLPNLSYNLQEAAKLVLQGFHPTAVISFKAKEEPRERNTCQLWGGNAVLLVMMMMS